MKHSFILRATVASGTLVLASVTAALAGDRIDHETARELLTAGKIRPLDEIVDLLREKVPGRILETELEYDDDGIVYDFKILRPGGRVQEVEVLAATGQILEIEDDD